MKTLLEIAFRSHWLIFLISLVTVVTNHVDSSVYTLLFRNALPNFDGREDSILCVEVLHLLAGDWSENLGSKQL